MGEEEFWEIGAKDCVEQKKAGENGQGRTDHPPGGGKHAGEAKKAHRDVERTLAAGTISERRGAEAAPVENEGAPGNRRYQATNVNPASPPGIIRFHSKEKAERQPEQRERGQLSLRGQHRPIHLDQHKGGEQ